MDLAISAIPPSLPPFVEFDPEFEFGSAQKFEFTEPPTPLIATAEKTALTVAPSFNAELRNAFLTYWDHPMPCKFIKAQRGCSHFRSYLNAFEHVKKNRECLVSFQALKAATRLRRATQCSPQKLLDILELYNSRQTDPGQKLPIPPSPQPPKSPQIALPRTKPLMGFKAKREKLHQAFRYLWVDCLPEKECVLKAGCAKTSFLVYKKAAERFFSFSNSMDEKSALDRAFESHPKDKNGRRKISKPVLKSILEIHKSQKPSKQ